MKSFDSVSIYDRMVAMLAQNPNWKAVVNDSVISTILKTSAEQLAEIARYSEYLFRETRWDAAQNISSIAAAAGQLGYKPARKKSAFGNIILSADPKIHLIGRTLPMAALTLGTWQTIPRDLYLRDSIVVKDSNDNNYVLASRSELLANTATATAIIAEGVKRSMVLPIEVLRALATRSKLDPYVYIPVELPNCEDASTPLTRRFFKVFVQYATATEEYRVVDTLHLSRADDADVEVYPDLYNPNILYLKFNASRTRGKILNLSTGTGVQGIEVQYIESRGAAGNLSRTFETFTLTGIEGEPGLKLFGINLEPISGGADEESVFDIKRNAPRYYMSNYTVATRESYENAIKRIDFGNASYPTRVRVYAGLETSAGTARPVTKVSMLLPGFEDRALMADAQTVYDDVESVIGFYLSELKAPVDVLRFVPPRYVTFAVGLDCTAAKAQVDNLLALKQGIRQLIDDKYGALSSDLDFARSVYASDIVAAAKQNYPALLSVKLETEATQILNWRSAERVQPISTKDFFTLRIPFSFDSVYRGRNYIKGFKDYQTGAAYAMRFDIFYRQAAKSTLPAYHRSIFIQEDPARNKPAFYHMTDIAAADPIWPSTVGSDYPINDASYAELETSYQFSLKKKVYTDDAFAKLIDPANLSYEQQSTAQASAEGNLDAFLVWYNNSVDDASGTIGAGCLELDIASIYSTLQTYASQDLLLASHLRTYDLATMQCGVGVPAESITGFIENVLIPYVEIHVSMRPLDGDLVLSDTEDHNNVVLLIDSSDTNSQLQTVTNLTQAKRERFISVECSLV